MDILKTKETNYIKLNSHNLLNIISSSAAYFSYKYDHVIVSNIVLVHIVANNIDYINYVDDRFCPNALQLSAHRFIDYTYNNDTNNNQYEDCEYTPFTPGTIVKDAVKLFKHNFNKYNQDPLIKYVIYSVYQNKNITDKTNNYYHENILIYDTTQKSFELFEPHGAIYDYSQFETILRQTIKFNNFYKPIDYCPREGFQIKDVINQQYGSYEGFYGGFCVMWCWWYCDLRLQNQSLDRNSVVQIAYDTLNSTNSFHNFIGDYTAFLFTLSKFLNRDHNNLNTENIILNTILRFFNMIDIDILVLDIEKEEILMPKIIKNSNKIHLKYIYDAMLLHQDDSIFNQNYNNSQLKKALTILLSELTNQQRIQIYKKFINQFYSNAYSDNIISKQKCPNDMSIINKLNNNINQAPFIRRKPPPLKLQSKYEKCEYFKNNIRKIPNNKENYLQLLLLLTDDDINDIYFGNKLGYFNTIMVLYNKYSDKTFTRVVAMVINNLIL
jgi:hypothetical protein